VKIVQKYIVLGNWTDHARETLDDIPKRLENSRKWIEELGGSLSVCFTMGEYDVIAIVDMPDEESMVKFLLKINATRGLKTKTLRAWSDSEFVKML
jgi:uncharacterized protein with GYD domain